MTESPDLLTARLAPVLAAVQDQLASSGCAVLHGDPRSPRVVATAALRTRRHQEALREVLNRVLWEGRALSLGRLLDDVDLAQAVAAWAPRFDAVMAHPLRIAGEGVGGVLVTVDAQQRLWSRTDGHVLRRWAAAVEVVLATSGTETGQVLPVPEPRAARAAAPSAQVPVQVVAAHRARAADRVAALEIDLRAAATAVVGYSELLEDMLGEPGQVVQQALLLDHVRRGARRLSSIAEQMTALPRDERADDDADRAV